jgi:hypothetical protein
VRTEISPTYSATYPLRNHKLKHPSFKRGAKIIVETNLYKDLQIMWPFLFSFTILQWICYTVEYGAQDVIQLVGFESHKLGCQ